MQIPKEQILEFLKSRGDKDQADKAQSELPDQVDTDKDQGLLGKFNIDPKDLLGGAGGGLTGKLGL
jgi:hypothetical protein